MREMSQAADCWQCLPLLADSPPLLRFSFCLDWRKGEGAKREMWRRSGWWVFLLSVLHTSSSTPPHFLSQSRGWGWRGWQTAKAKEWGQPLACWLTHQCGRELCIELLFSTLCTAWGTSELIIIGKAAKKCCKENEATPRGFFSPGLRRACASLESRMPRDGDESRMPSLPPRASLSGLARRGPKVKPGCQGYPWLPLATGA